MSRPSVRSLSTRLKLGTLLCLALLRVQHENVDSTFLKPASLQQHRRPIPASSKGVTAVQEISSRLQHLERQAVPAEEIRPTPLWHSFTAFVCAVMVAFANPSQEHWSISSPAYAEEALSAEEKQTVDLFQRNTPGVVFVTTQVFEISNAERMQIEAVPRGSGSGWVYDDKGHIVTNFHVIQNANLLTVKTIEGTELPAKVVGADPGSDVAVLQVDVPSKSLLRPLVRGDSASLRVGQVVYAIGNPFGLDHTLTKGIVSGVGRTIMSVGGRPIQGAIQTDASINPGNSGGPLLNSQGKVIGMNTEIISPSGGSAGVGFAIPSDTVSARVASILKYGYVKRPSLGIYLGQDGLAPRLTGRLGGVVAGLQREGAAGKAGIQPGDVILQVDERKITRVNDVFAELDEHEPRETIKVKVWRPDQPELLGTPNSGVMFRELSMDVKLQEAPVET
jgi:S1-C subfamily serine protease